LLLSIDLKYRDIWKVEENLVGGRNEMKESAPDVLNLEQRKQKKA
jgi:hypothetical protein